jgi:uncharacterized protein YidB (DUF937 family)
MAGLDDLLGGLLGGGDKGGSGAQGAGGLDLGKIAAVVLGAVAGKKMSGGGLGGMLAGAAGGGMLDKLLDGFKKNGMDGKTASWVGTGENEPVTADEVERALGPAAIDEVAREAGVSREEAREGLAQTLPTMVDKMTPNGQLPSDDELQGMLSKALGDTN